MSDLGEFFAGTIPTNAASVLHYLTPVPQNTGLVRLDWPTVPDRSYRVWSSDSTLTNWIAATAWQRANGNIFSFTTNLASGPRFYRVEVKP